MLFLILLSLSLTIITHAQTNGLIKGDVISKEDSILCGPVRVEAVSDSGWTAFVKQVSLTTEITKRLPDGIYSMNVRLVVGKDGCVLNAVCVPDSSFTDQECSLISSKFISYPGRWKPAMQNGRLVKAYIMQPVTFIVTKKDQCAIKETIE